MKRLGVLGVGSWGTALGIMAARSGHEVVLWGWTPDQPERMDEQRENRRYLPGIAFPDTLTVTSRMDELDDCDVLIGAVPSSATSEVAQAASPHVREGAVWVSATKGLEPGTRRRMSEVVLDVLPHGTPVAALSGPSFAREVAGERPTAVVVACADVAVARRLQEALSCPTFRAYASDDIIGVELGGALKNVIAVAAGLVVGLELGHDALAALITRGLREMTVLGTSLGARAETFVGLAGLGDLVLTCTGADSRNRRLGEMLAKGASLAHAQASLGQVSEGVATVQRAMEEAQARGLRLPIMESVHEVIFLGSDPREAVDRLMQRGLRDEAP